MTPKLLHNKNSQPKYHEKNIFIGLGSNQEPRLLMLQQAKIALQKYIDPKLIESPIYETPPWKILSHNYFLNQVLQICSPLPPKKLLAKFLQIEKKLGRKRNRTPDRNIDIDLLYYKNLCCQNDTLQLPQKDVEKRAFVILPMNNIAPQFMHPVLRKTQEQLLNELPPQALQNIRKITP